MEPICIECMLDSEGHREHDVLNMEKSFLRLQSSQGQTASCLHDLQNRLDVSYENTQKVIKDIEGQKDQVR